MLSIHESTAGPLCLRWTASVPDTRAVSRISSALKRSQVEAFLGLISFLALPCRGVVQHDLSSPTSSRPSLRGVQHDMSV